VQGARDAGSVYAGLTKSPTVFPTVIRSSDMTALIVILTIAAASRLKAIPI
jgi:hypothetical protein